MPEDELLNESGIPEEESSVSVEPSQEQEPSSDDSTDGIIEDSSPEFHPDYFPENYVPDDLESDVSENDYGDTLDEPSNEDISDVLPDELVVDESLDDGSSVSANDIDYEQIQEMINRSVSENNALYLSGEYVVLEDLEEFESSTILVDRYQYAILKDLEFMKYSNCIVIALLFLILFMRYKR